MKKIYFTILSFFAVVAVNAQLTQANHAPANGETYQMYRCDSIATTSGASGADVSWNYATITTFSNLVRSYTAATTSNANYPQANINLASAANDLSYLASATSSLGYYGGNISVGTIAGSINYTAPAIYASYPMSLNTTTTSVTGGSISITSPFPTTGTFAGSSSAMVDASGTISLPGGITYTDVVRVVTNQTLNITTQFAPATVFQRNYEWFAAGVKAPVFTIMTATATVLGNTTTQTVVARNKNLTAPPTGTTTVGLDENTGVNIQFSAFPNPSNTFVNFATNHPDANTVSVFDITGKLVEKQNLNEGKSKVDVSSFNKGLYLYSISSKEGKTLKSGKITVSQ
ncbi:hypothetical protein CNR22_06620 [Sphingobacteriaceae bacterium]|nr:hypothetical protein CNR22_06620 [Sphingobacteriaceae bacterium]